MAGGQIEDPARSRGEDSWFSQRHLEPPQVTSPYFDIGVEIDARESPGGLIPGGESSTLGSYRNRQNADSGLKCGGNIGRVIHASVGDDDDVQITPLCCRQKLAQQAPDNVALIMRGNDDAHHNTAVWTVSQARRP